jgi:PAS domain S-box-containing protein
MGRLYYSSDQFRKSALRVPVCPVSLLSQVLKKKLDKFFSRKYVRLVILGGAWFTILSGIILIDGDAPMKERKGGEARTSALKFLGRTYRALVENALVGVYQTTLAGDILYVNDTFLRMLGFASEEEMASTGSRGTYRNPDDREVLLQLLKQTGSLNTVSEVSIDGRVYETRKFPVSLGDSKKGIGGFVRDVTERKRTEEDLRVKSLNLAEVNAALRVLLKQREQDRNELEDKILYNVKKLVLPYLERLKERRLDDEQRTYLNILETNLNNIVSPFIKKMTHMHSHFTLTEISVANFIKDGKTIKEIARVFGVSENAVNRHRQSIRNKLNLNKQKVNLRTFLMSLD